MLAVAIQLIFDFLFYLMFSAIPLGKNDMLDMFKSWAKYAKLDALWGDSILVLVGVVVSAYLNQRSFNENMFWLIFGAMLVRKFNKHLSQKGYRTTMQKSRAPKRCQKQPEAQNVDFQKNR